MSRHPFAGYQNDKEPRYITVFGLQWQLIDCRRVDAAADLPAAMTAAIEQLEREGWQAEGEPDYGSVFIRRKTERRLLMLTPRDPRSTTLQTFSPFRCEVQ